MSTFYFVYVPLSYALFQRFFNTFFSKMTSVGWL